MTVDYPLDLKANSNGVTDSKPKQNGTRSDGSSGSAVVLTTSSVSRTPFLTANRRESVASPVVTY